MSSRIVKLEITISLKQYKAWVCLEHFKNIWEPVLELNRPKPIQSRRAFTMDIWGKVLSWDKGTFEAKKQYQHCAYTRVRSFKIVPVSRSNVTDQPPSNVAMPQSS